MTRHQLLLILDRRRDMNRREREEQRALLRDHNARFRAEQERLSADCLHAGGHEWTAAPNVHVSVGPVRVAPPMWCMWCGAPKKEWWMSGSEP